MMTPKCRWCGVEQKFRPRTAVTEYAFYEAPLTSSLWPSIHMHFSCMFEFRRAIWDEIPSSAGSTILEEITSRDHKKD